MAKLCIVGLGLVTTGICFAVLCFHSLIPLAYCAKKDFVVKELPDCSVRTTTPRERSVSDLKGTASYKELLLVSTLDGHVSALDPYDGGKIVWSHGTGLDSMVSSSITQLEMSSNGQQMRLIPSLDGNLYKFNGKSLEPIPVSVDTLLKSSFRLGDDVVITGSKDSLSFGIDLQSGKMRYTCSAQGCQTYEGSLSEHEDVLVLRRLTQTVRAVTPRTGEERWNFSVSEHQATFLAKIEADCSGGSSNSHATSFDDDGKENLTDNKQVKVIVPDGVIALVNDVQSDVFWSHKFDSPIVHAWHLKDNKLNSINLFEQNTVVRPVDGKPILYLGRHHHQLYIQQSKEMKVKIRNALHYVQTATEIELPTIEWKPYIVTGSSRTPYINHGKETSSMIGHTQVIVDQSTTALVLKQDDDVLDYPYDSGYYLYGSESLRNSIENYTCNKEEVSMEENDEMFDNFMKPIISLWYWWKEVCGISLATSILFHVLYTRRAVKKIKKKLTEEKSGSGVNSGSSNNLQQSSQLSPDASEKTLTSSSDKKQPEFSCEYESRYIVDFEPIQRLGKGGFGVVFEARNKIDDCHYAVKRILLPDSLRAQEKVMREVKALAKLDNPGIVRYFNAWQESPPPGWQEQHDLQWDENSQALSTNIPTHSIASMTPNQLSSASTTRNQSSSPIVVNHNFPKNFNNPLKISENFSMGSTMGFSQNVDESGSFSFHHDKSVDSLDVVFHNNTSQSSMHLNINYNDGSGDSSSNISSINSNATLPFTSKSNNFYSHQLSQSLSVTDAKNEDSGCDSTDEEFLSLDNNLVEIKNNINLQMMKQSRPNVLSLKSKSSDDASPVKLYLYIQMQLCRKETLKDWLVVNTARERDEVLDIFDQIVSAVQYVHDCNLMHRDLKPSNIFFSVDGTIKVGDFGLVTAMTESEVHSPVKASDSGISSRHTNQVGTQLYMSPEQLAGQSYCHKVDIFSLGLIFFELLHPFQTQMERVDVMFNVKKHAFPKEFNTKYPNECALVKEMLSHNPMERPSAVEIKKHALLKAFQPEPEVYARHRRRRTFSQRFSNSSSDCDSAPLQENSTSAAKTDS